MKYSKLFGKTIKEAPKDEASVNAQLLERAGFVFKEMAGVYSFLPLGLMVTVGIVGLVEIVVATLIGAYFYQEEA